MSIQTGTGELRIDADDAQFTYRGKTIAIKIRALTWPVILGCKKNDDGTWSVVADMTDDLFSSDVIGHPDAVKYWVDKHGGGKGFVGAVVMSRLNAWLAIEFPETAAPLTALEEIQSALMGIRFVPQADGTLKASLV